MIRRSSRLLAALFATLWAVRAGGAEVSATVTGRVDLPAVCATTASHAVAVLEPVDRPAPFADARPKAIDQKGLRFEPRVAALSVGQTLRFGNADSELHNVHVQKSRVVFNRNVSPGGSIEFVPREPGVYKVLCDVHDHMRAFVVVGGSPWVSSCDRTGAFRFKNVPEGRYRLVLWNEWSEPSEKAVEVRGRAADLGNFSLALGTNSATADDREQVCLKGCEPWPLVIDRIGVTLSLSLNAADKPGDAAALAQDAYHRDLTTSGLKTAIRVHLGRDRASQVEDTFREITEAAGAPDSSEGPSARALSLTRKALIQLTRASGELNRVGVTESSNIFAKTSPAFWVESSAAGEVTKPPVGLETATWTARVPVLAWGFMLAALVATAPRIGLRRAFLVMLTGALVAEFVVVVGRISLVDATSAAFLAGLAGLAASLGALDLGSRTFPRLGMAITYDTPALDVSLALATFLAVAEAGLTTGFTPDRLDVPVVVTGAGVALATLLLIRRRAPRVIPGRSPGWAAVVLCVLAVAYAGRGVTELQAARYLRTDAASWLGPGLPAFGVVPTLQALEAQGVLVAAVLAIAVLASGRGTAGEAQTTATASA